MKRSIIIEIIILLYSILILYTAISKIMEYNVFKEQLAESLGIKPVASFLVIILPVFEFLAVIMLLIPRFRLKGLYFSLSLMIPCTLYIIALLAFKRDLPCSGGYVLTQLSWSQHLLLNSFFIAVSIIAIAFQTKVRKISRLQFVSIFQISTKDIHSKELK
jgi:hypothetical protein